MECLHCARFFICRSNILV